MSRNRVFVGMETSGAFRRRFSALGFDVISCDRLPADDGDTERHIQGDVFAVLDTLRGQGWWPDLAIFHPTCTYLTISAEWAYSDGPYHQRVKPGTLVGADRRAARLGALDTVRRIFALDIARKVIENPRGVIGSIIRPPTQSVQPWEFGDDASKETCFWYLDRDEIELPAMRFPVTDRTRGRFVEWGGKMVERFANQTDSGQNALSPDDDRWKERSKTYPGIADAATAWWARQMAIEPVRGENWQTVNMFA